MRPKLIVLLTTASIAMLTTAACSGANLTQRQSPATLAVALINANPVTPVHTQPTRPSATSAPAVATPALSPVALKKYAWLWVENLKTLKGSLSPLTLAISPDGQSVTASTEEGGSRIAFRMWDIASGNLHLFESQSPLSGYFAAGVSPDMKLLAIGTPAGDIDLWDLATGRELKSMYGNKGGIKQIVYSDAGNLLAVATWNNVIVIYDLAKGAAVASVPLEFIGRIAVSPDFRQMAVVDETNLTLWDMATLKPVRDFDTQTIKGIYGDPEFSPDGKWIVASVQNEEYALQVWDAATGQTRQRLAGLSGAVTDATFTSDGSLLAGGLSDGTIRIWDVAGWSELQVLDTHSDSKMRVAFSPDGSRLASATVDGTITLWGVKDQSP